jgi:branched-chain amino acid transport system permease protein
MNQFQSEIAHPVGLPVGMKILGCIALVLVVAAPWSAGSFVQHLAILVCLNIISVVGLALISRSGQLSFGHAAFVAIGAYVSVIAERQLGFGIWLSGLAGILVCGLVAGILGWVILRLRGVYFILVTFAFGELTRLALLAWDGITGGANGITNIKPVTLFGTALDSRPKFYALAVIVALSLIAGLRELFKKPLGHAIDSVSQNPALAESTGLNVFRIQLLVFVVGCALAALSGVLQARYIGYISPESFNTGVTTGFIIMLVIGGRSSVWGPFIGALVLTPLPEFFRGAVQAQYVLYGIALILILRFLPDGLASLGRRFWGRGQGR